MKVENGDTQAGGTNRTLDQIQRELAAARLATRRQAKLLGLVESDDEGRVSPSGESTDELTPLPADAGPSPPSWFAGHTRTSPGLSELMSSQPGPHEADWYFSPIHSESSTRTSSRWQASPASSRTTPPSAVSKDSKGPRSPRVKNTGKVLAPHGTFTSRRVIADTQAPPLSSGESGASGTSARSRHSQNSRSSLRVDAIEEPKLTEEERIALEKAAKRGDQLAMYRLGWLALRPDPRYSLGAVDDVWGPVEYVLL